MHLIFCKQVKRFQESKFLYEDRTRNSTIYLISKSLRENVRSFVSEFFGIGIFTVKNEKI